MMNTNQPDLQLGLKCGFAGEYGLQKRNAAGEVVEELKFKNLITDVGLDLLGGNGFHLYPALGIGTAAPTVSDVALTSPARFSSRLSWTVVPATVAPYVSSSVGSSQSTQGGAAGTWTEIGLYTGPSSGVLFSRALIVDNLGNPTSITVLPTEFLTVTYTLRLVIPDVDVITNADGRTYTTRAALVTTNDWTPAYGSDTLPTFSNMSFFASPGAIASITSAPSGQLGTQALSGSLIASYVPGSFEQTGTATFSITDGNGTINSFICRPALRVSSFWLPFQIGVSPAIVKDNTQTLTVSFKVQWGRAA